MIAGTQDKVFVAKDSVGTGCCLKIMGFGGKYARSESKKKTRTSLGAERKREENKRVMQ